MPNFFSKSALRTTDEKGNIKAKCLLLLQLFEIKYGPLR